MKKRIPSLFLAAVMTLSLASAAWASGEPDASGAAALLRRLVRS